MKRKIRVTKLIREIFPKYRPQPGEIYDAEYSPARREVKCHYAGKGEFAVIDILDKRIVLRRGEFEIVGG